MNSFHIRVAAARSQVIVGCVDACGVGNDPVPVAADGVVQM